MDWERSVAGRVAFRQQVEHLNRSCVWKAVNGGSVSHLETTKVSWLKEQEVEGDVMQTRRTGENTRLERELLEVLQDRVQRGMGWEVGRVW